MRKQDRLNTLIQRGRFHEEPHPEIDKSIHVFRAERGCDAMTVVVFPDHAVGAAKINHRTEILAPEEAEAARERLNALHL